MNVHDSTEHTDESAYPTRCLELKTEGLEEQGASGEPRIHDPENRPRRL